MKRLFLSALIFIGMGGVCFSAECPPGQEMNGCFFGIFREGAPANIKLVKDFEKKVGKKMPVIMWYQDWSTPFNPDLANKAIKNGAIPHIVWEPWLWRDKERIKLDNINAGEWDSYIKEYARDVRDWGHPIFIRWGHEFNIEGYPWCIVNNGRDPKKYVSAFRRVRNIFKNEGAANAKFVWCPMNDSWPKEKWNDMHLAYPGDDYVDWIGLDGYNWGTSQPWSQWQTFKELFRDVARQMWRKYPTKPVMIAEFGCSEKGGDKAAWIADILPELKKMPYIKSVNWFDEKKEADWRIETNAKTLAAFKKIISQPYFIPSSALLSDLVASSSMNIGKRQAFAKYSSSVSLDGNISEWTDTEPLLIDQASQVQEGSSIWKGPADLSGKIYVKWDNSNLYIAGDINDNIPLKNQKKKHNIWNGDAIEMTIGLSNTSDHNRDSFVKGDMQIGFGTGNGSTVSPSVWNWTASEAPEGAEIVVNSRNKGYIFEARIPWASLSTFKPSAGMRIAFDCAIDDSDDNARTKQIVWNGDFMFYKDPGVWGALEFVR